MGILHHPIIGDLALPWLSLLCVDPFLVTETFLPFGRALTSFSFLRLASEDQWRKVKEIQLTEKRREKRGKGKEISSRVSPLSTKYSVLVSQLRFIFSSVFSLILPDLDQGITGERSTQTCKKKPGGSFFFLTKTSFNHERCSILSIDTRLTIIC